MFVKDSIIPHIIEAKNSTATWTMLKILYETSNTNRILFLKTKLLGIKMDGNEFVSSFLGRIKEVKEKLGNIGETISSTDLVTITLNGMLDDYQMFITGLAAREKPPTFEELTGILLQEEERRGNLKPQNKDLALWSNKRSVRGRSGERGRGGSSSQRRHSLRPNQFIQPNKTESKSFFYYGRPGHIVKDCHKKKSDGARNKPRTHSGHYAEKSSNQYLRLFIASDDIDEPMNFDSRDLRLFVSNVSLSAKIDDIDAWFVDPRASVHMTCNKNWYANFKETHNGASIYLGDDRAHHIKGYGDIHVTLSNGIVCHIRNVVYVPGIKKNLISVSTITDQNLKVEFFKNYCIVKDLLDHFQIVATGVRAGGLYKLDVTSKAHHALTSATMPIEILWHQRYGHINHLDLLLLQKKNMVEGLPMLKNENVACDGCALGKMHKDEFPSNLDRKKRYVLDLVHTDVCGPMQTRSLGGAFYFLLFIDDCTRYTWVYFLRRKSDAFEYFKEFRTMVGKQKGKSIKILHSNQGGEYKSRDFNKYCKDHGIVQLFTIPHTPQHNGVAERKNRTLVECARSMIKGKNLSNSFWVEAINTTVYLKNRSPTRCLDNVTPFKALYGSKPAIHNLKVFGCKDFSHIPKENRKKLDAKAIKCIFISVLF
jgi:hypothetical protein